MALGIAIALGVSIVCALFLWARAVVGVTADEAAQADPDDCMSGWDIREAVVRDADEREGRS